MAFPTGTTAKTFMRGYGGSALYEYRLLENLNIVGSVGYMMLRYRTDVKAKLENFGEDTHVNGVIPAKAGARYYFGGIYYLDLQAGAAFAVGDDSYAAFTYAPGLGAVIPISKYSGADVGLRYEGWARAEKTIAFFGLRAAITFAL